MYLLYIWPTVFSVSREYGTPEIFAFRTLLMMRSMEEGANLQKNVKITLLIKIQFLNLILYLLNIIFIIRNSPLNFVS